LFDGVAATSFNIIENTAGVDVTELSALDPDEGQTHTFTLTDGVTCERGTRKSYISVRDKNSSSQCHLHAH
jgi:hypothetical protein